MTRKLGVVLVLAFLSTGCTADILGRMSGFDVLQIIQSQPVTEAVAKGKNIGTVFAGIEALILAFVSWYRIHAGGQWLAITKDWFFGILVCALILTSAGTSAGFERWIWSVGVYLGQQFNPTQGFLMENFNKAVGQHADVMMTLQKAAPNLDPDTQRMVEAVVWQFSSPYAAGLVGLNAIAIYLMKMVMQVSYAWLISFYWMLTPLVTPMIILPPDKERLPRLAEDLRQRGAPAHVLRFRGTPGSGDPLERMAGTVRRRRRELADGHELVPRRADADDLQHRLLLRVPLHPSCQLPDRVRRLAALPDAVGLPPDRRFSEAD